MWTVKTQKPFNPYEDEAEPAKVKRRGRKPGLGKNEQLSKRFEVAVWSKEQNKEIDRCVDLQYLLTGYKDDIDGHYVPHYRLKNNIAKITAFLEYVKASAGTTIYRRKEYPTLRHLDDRPGLAVYRLAKPLFLLTNYGRRQKKEIMLGHWPAGSEQEQLTALRNREAFMATALQKRHQVSNDMPMQYWGSEITEMTALLCWLRMFEAGWIRTLEDVASVGQYPIAGHKQMINALLPLPQDKWSVLPNYKGLKEIKNPFARDEMNSRCARVLAGGVFCRVMGRLGALSGVLWGVSGGALYDAALGHAGRVLAALGARAM